MAESKEQWHITKGIPASLLIGLFVQLIAVVWVISDISHMAEIAVKQAQENYVEVGNLRDGMNSNTKDIAVIKSKISAYH